MFKLYDYQLEIIDKARKLFTKTDSVLIQSPPR
nr:MAG TPA: Histone H3.2, Histone H4, Histone, Chromatin, Nucleosome, DNA, SNF2h [Caudoviricetes sp.]